MLPVDENGIPISGPVFAKDLDLDFKAIRTLNNNGKPIEVDHNFVFQILGKSEEAFVTAKTFRELFSTEPGLQVYTGKG